MKLPEDGNRAPGAAIGLRQRRLCIASGGAPVCISWDKTSVDGRFT